MNKLQELLVSASKPQRSTVSTNKKRKWREIEQLKEKFQLAIISNVDDELFSVSNK